MTLSDAMNYGTEKSIVPFLGCAIYVTTKLIARTFLLLTGGQCSLQVNIVYKDRNFPKFRE